MKQGLCLILYAFCIISYDESRIGLCIKEGNTPEAINHAEDVIRSLNNECKRTVKPEKKIG